MIEEAQEVSSTNSRDDFTVELAGVTEVIFAIAQASQISIDEVDAARIQKRKVNGYFSSENDTNYIEIPENNHNLIGYIENKNRSYKFQGLKY